MLKNFLISKLILCSLLLPVWALPNSDELRDFLLSGNVDAVIASVEADKKFFKDGEIKKAKRIFKLSKKSIYYYFIALIVVGDIDKLQDLGELVFQRYDASPNFIEIRKQIDFFTKNNLENIDESFYQQEEIAFFRFESKLTDYLIALNNFREKEAVSDLLISDLKLPLGLLLMQKRVLDLASAYNQNPNYFPSKDDYLLKLQSKELTAKIEKKALALIKEKQSILFPKTDDFFELANAYKSLAVIKVAEGDIKAATQFISLGKSYIFKMKALWLKEDLILERPILKIDKRVTRFGYLFPQWLIHLRQEFDAYLGS